jgi:ABC-2 type transport system ATP-binding protein
MSLDYFTATGFAALRSTRGPVVVLEVRNLTKRFRGATVVDHANFDVRPGEITGYLGPNGSGKSTTVKILTGLLQPSSGEIFFNGQNIYADPVGFKQRLGYVPEEPNLYGYLTGLEYLQLAGGLRDLPSDCVNRRANELLELFYLHDARWVPISNYSKGMKQRVLIAAALLHDPDVLIFDEAQSGLDIANSLLFRHVLRELAARGKCVLYISHVLELVERVCEHIVVIYKGRIVADDSVSRLRDLMQLPSLEEIFTQLVQQDDMESRARAIASVMTK